MIILASLAKKWADVFSVLGSVERLSILIVLYGSKFIRHKHYGIDEKEPEKGCLTFTQILKSIEIESDTRLSYHLSKLIDAKLVEKRPFMDKNGRIFPLYATTDRWNNFAHDFGFDKEIKSYIKDKYPEAFREIEENSAR